MTKKILESLTDEHMNKVIVVKGKAANCKASACLQLKDGCVIYLMGKHEWKEEYHNQIVLVEGKISNKKLIPDVKIDKNGAISAGAVGEQYVLTDIVKIKKK